MTPRQSKFIAAGALILGGFLTFRALQPSPATPDASPEGTGSAMPGKSGGDRIDPARSPGRLRSLREIRASDAPDFETVESWTRLGTADRFPLPFPGSTSSDPSGLHNPHVMTGLFKGLRSKEDLESTINTWTAQVWKSTGTTKALGAHLAHVASGSSQSRARPPELEVALQAAISLAAHDFNAAESWLQGLTAGSDDLDNQQRERFHLLWALARPAEAFAYLKAGSHPEQQQQYATAVLCRLPSRGPELMAALDSAEIRYKAIQVAASDLGIYSTHDYYPAPGQANRLPDFEANYAAILATLAAAKLPPDREADLLKRIHWDFQSRVPAADAAARR